MFGRFKRRLSDLVTSRRQYDELRMIGGLAVISANRQRYRECLGVKNYDAKIFSQFGEDGILDYLLDINGIQKPSFVEIGTGDYAESNTRFLFQRTGGKGLIIDCDSRLEEKVCDTLGSYYWKGDLSVKSEFVTRDNILSLLMAGDDDWLGSDIFSLDIDGVDYWILKAIGERLRAGIVVLEYNAYFGAQKSVTVPYSDRFNRSAHHVSNLAWGASLVALRDLMKELGYFFIGSNINCQNGFWLKDDLYANSRRELEVLDLESCVMNCCRESRDAKGNMTFVRPTSRLNEMRDAVIIDLADPLREKTVDEVFRDVL